MPYVKDFDSKGELTLGWSDQMDPYREYNQIKTSTIVVQGVPRGLQSIDENFV